MGTIINSMDRAILISKKRTNHKRLLLKSFLLGILGYFIFLFTLTAAYWLLFNLFALGSAHIDHTDFLISSLGFIVLSSFIYKRGIK